MQGLIASQWQVITIQDLRPAEVLWINGKAELIRERETFEDLTKGQIEVNVALDTPLAAEV